MLRIRLGAGCVQELLHPLACACHQVSLAESLLCPPGRSEEPDVFDGANHAEACDEPGRVCYVAMCEKDAKVEHEGNVDVA